MLATIDGPPIYLFLVAPWVESSLLLWGQIVASYLKTLQSVRLWWYLSCGYVMCVHYLTAKIDMLNHQVRLYPCHSQTEEGKTWSPRSGLQEIQFYCLSTSHACLLLYIRGRESWNFLLCWRKRLQRCYWLNVVQNTSYNLMGMVKLAMEVASTFLLLIALHYRGSEILVIVSLLVPGNWSVNKVSLERKLLSFQSPCENRGGRP